MMRALWSFTLCCAVCTTAWADGPAGDDRGALLAAPCSGCHRVGPERAGAIPGFERLDAREIAQKLNAYRSGELRGTLMNRIARGYTEDEIVLLAKALGSSSE